MTQPAVLSLCNEMLAQEGHSLAEQARIARELGYQGLELAPGTLHPAPHTLDQQAMTDIRATIEREGISVTGLHWLLAPYPHASIIDPKQRKQTQSILIALVDQCAALGGSVLVHGSPSSRMIPIGMSDEDAIFQASQCLRPVAHRAQDRGVTYCFEPLSRAETAFINTVEQAKRLVDAVDNSAFETMIDSSAAGQAEPLSVAKTIARWVPTGIVAHMQLNDTNRGAPGTGNDPFGEIIAALRQVGWTKPIAIEPFTARLNAVATAAIGAATVRALWNAAAASTYSFPTSHPNSQETHP